jgi:hypothetical protein
MISLEGIWQFRIGDDPAFATVPLPAKFAASTDFIFEPRPVPFEGPGTDLGRLREKYHGKIKTGIDGKNYERNARNMLKLFREWDPVGHTVGELEFVLGAPSSADEQGSLVYWIDSGYVGVSWLFHTKEGRVIRVDKQTNP